MTRISFSLASVLALTACGGASSETDAAPGTPDATLATADATTPDAPPADAAACSIPFDETITATLAVTADDSTRIYVNGALIDETPTLWYSPKSLTVTLYRSPLRANVIAIQASNSIQAGGYDRGLLADLRFTPGGAVEGDVSLVTDLAWKITPTSEEGWFEADHDDAAWAAPVVEGPYGMAPWGDVFSSIAPGSDASWLWLYDSAAASKKPTAEDMWARRTFWINSRGGTADTAPGCN